jgi:hypothetical protein
MARKPPPDELTIPADVQRFAAALAVDLLTPAFAPLPAARIQLRADDDRDLGGVCFDMVVERLAVRVAAFLVERDRRRPHPAIKALQD